MNISNIDRSALNAAVIGYVGSFIIEGRYVREKDFFSTRSCILQPEDLNEPLSSAILSAIIKLNHLSEICSVDNLAHVLLTEGLITTEGASVFEQPKTYTEICDLLEHYARFGAKTIKDFRLRERLCKDQWRNQKLDIRAIERIMRKVESEGGSSLDMALALRNYTEDLIGETETISLTTDWSKQKDLFDEIPKQNRELVGKPRFTFPPHWCLDSYVPVLRPGEMVVLSGQTAGGKSSMAMMFAEYCCFIGKNVLVLHLEDYSDIILQRQTVRWIGGSLGELERGDSHGLMAKMKNLRQQWADKRGGSITYKYLAGHTTNLIVDSIKETARELESEDLRLDVVVLDYFQKINHQSGIGRGTNFVNSAEESAEMLKIVTQRLKLVTLIASQETDDGNGGVHIAWSKALGHKAQVHLSVSRQKIKNEKDREVVVLEQYSNPLVIADIGEKSCWLKVEIVKANSGKSGEKYLYFDAPHFKIYDKQFMIDVKSGKRREFDPTILNPADDTFYKNQQREMDKWSNGYIQLNPPNNRV